MVVAYFVNVDAFGNVVFYFDCLLVGERPWVAAVCLYVLFRTGDDPASFSAIDGFLFSKFFCA